MEDRGVTKVDKLVGKDNLEDRPADMEDSQVDKLEVKDNLEDKLGDMEVSQEDAYAPMEVVTLVLEDIKKY